MIPGAKYLKRKKGRLKCRRHRKWLENPNDTKTLAYTTVTEGGEVGVACLDCLLELGEMERAKDIELKEIVEEAEAEDSDKGLDISFSQEEMERLLGEAIEGEGDLADGEETCMCGEVLCWMCNFNHGGPFQGRDLEMVRRRRMEGPTFVDTGAGLIRVGGPEKWVN